MVGLRRFLPLLTFVVAIGLACIVQADEWFAVLRLDQLDITAGDPPTSATEEERQFASEFFERPPRVAIDGDGEAFLERQPFQPRQPWLLVLPDAQMRIAVRTPAPRDVTGVLIWPKRSGQARRIGFRIPADRGSPGNRTAFLEIRLQHYGELCRRGIPGSAWFRHQALETSRALGKTDYVPPSPAGLMGRDLTADPTLELFSGERALHENLQLDRQLASSTPAPLTVPIASIAGIRAKEIDWAPLIREKRPALDPLATLIPHDQHAFFFPNAGAIVQVFDTLEREAGGLLRAAEGMSADHQLLTKYERQLGLSLKQFALADSPLAKSLTPGLIQSIAMTGGDPYFRTGTDLAVLMETQSPATLRTMILAEVATKHPDSPTLHVAQGKRAGADYWSRYSQDHSVRSFILELDRCLVVSNSLAQIHAIADTAAKQRDSLASLPEYVFFRDRYRRDDKAESALLVISDAAIRRWCGPQWRIGQSRRLRAAAVLAEHQCGERNRVLGRDDSKSPEQIPDVPAMGPLTRIASGVHSATYGNLAFLTPISELDLSRVSEDEQRRYITWRDQYERYWTQSFDPIALRLGVQPRQIEFDLTIMPLIQNSNYRWMSQLSRNSKLTPSSGEPHAGCLIHFVHAIQPSGPDSVAHSFLRSLCMDEQGRGDPAKWLGESIALYVEEDPVWRKYTKFSDLERLASTLSPDSQLPVALRIAIKDANELSYAIPRLRVVLDQLNGGSSRWTPRDYRGQRYNCRVVEPSEVRNALFGSTLYSLVLPDQWLISYSEPLIHRAIDRHLQATAGAAAKPDKPNSADAPVAPASNIPLNTPLASQPGPWLGGHTAVELTGPFSPTFLEMMSANYDRRMRQISRQSIPILNEWKRLYPDRDPVDVHERLWGVRLECPAGGKLVWNAELRTVESTVLGSPDQPRSEIVRIPEFQHLKRLGLGLTFENEGLRARGVWQTTAPAAR